MVAHAGGWDELLIMVGAIALVVLLGKRRGPRPSRYDGPGPCAYCGESLSADQARCPSCGFKAIRLEPDRGLPEEAPPRS